MYFLINTSDKQVFLAKCYFYLIFWWMSGKPSASEFLWAWDSVSVSHTLTFCLVSLLLLKMLQKLWSSSRIFLLVVVLLVSEQAGGLGPARIISEVFLSVCVKPERPHLRVLARYWGFFPPLNIWNFFKRGAWIKPHSHQKLDSSPSSQPDSWCFHWTVCRKSLCWSWSFCM